MKRNIQRIALSIALAAAAFPFCAAQEVTRSAQIPGLRPYKVDLEYMPRAEKDSVRMVAELWKGYVESFTSSSVDEAAGVPSGWTAHLTTFRNSMTATSSTPLSARTGFLTSGNSAAAPTN